MYDGLHRHLSYRNWISHQATAANGVCQGCSMSLLAINVYNKVWCHLLDHLPEILVRAYVDDLYLWCKLQNAATLQKAIDLTKICSVVKSSMIGAKIIPQISFGAHITKIPQQALRSIQSAIAKALWTGQPTWRSMQLLQCILSQPHRTHPQFAGPYLTIIETARLCWNNSVAVDKLLRTWNGPSGNHSRAKSLQSALDCLGIEYDEHLNISFLQSPFVSLSSFSPRCISRALQNIVRHACYCSLDPKSRKDFSKPSGILDYQQTTSLLRSRPMRESVNRECALRLENILVGCTLTNDRLASSGWVTSATCRFCDAEKESMPRLIQCPQVLATLGAPVLHEFGSSFALLGHIQHPLHVAKRRLQISDVDSIGLAQNFSADHFKRMWTDGSVIHAHCFWITNATYAVLDESRTIRHQGLVHHWNVSAYYSAELWAIIVTCARAAFVTYIYSDCQSVVERQADLVFQGGSPSKEWMHFSWWTSLAHIVRLRGTVVSRPFLVEWIPVHCYENIPIELLSNELASLRTLRLSIFIATGW